MTEQRLEDELVKELSKIMGRDFWCYFKREHYGSNACTIDVNHFVRAKGYQLIIDYASEKKLKDDILNVVMEVWGQICERGESNTTKREMLRIIFNAMGEFIRFSLSGLSEKNYRREIKSLYDKYNSFNSIMSRAKTEVKKLQIRIDTPPMITPPFLPADAFYIALEKLNNLGIPMDASKILLKIVFNNNTYKMSTYLKEYQSKKFNFEMDTRKKKYIREDRDMEKFNNDFSIRKKAFDEGRYYYGVSSPYYMLELESEKAHADFMENWTITPWIDAPLNKNDETFDEPKKIVYD